MSFIKDALSAVGKLTGVASVKDAANIIIGAIKKDPTLEKELARIELEHKKLAIKEAEGVRDLFKAEIKSEDSYIRRARPTFLYMGYILIALDLGILSLANAISAGFGGPAIPFAVLPREFYALFTIAFTGYTAARSVDKRDGKRDKVIRELMNEIKKLKEKSNEN